MKLPRLPYLLFSALIIFIACATETAEQKKSATTTLSEPSLSEKIGQMIMVGFRDAKATEGTEIYNLVKEHNIGGVCLYHRDLPSKDSLGRNVESVAQLQQLNKQLQAISPTNLIIAIDEEGGKVSRLWPDRGFQKHKSHQAIGTLNNLDSTRIWAKQMATELADLGINMNFGPVVDLNINPACPVIGKIERSFSADPNVVIAHSKVFMEEHRKQNIMCVPKHFPGHGSATNDSHMGLTDVTTTWSEIELIPYTQLIKEGLCDLVMTAHVYNAQLDTLPSTLSPKIIHEILRKKLNFNKVIISDDMHMKAITNFYNFEDAIEKAIESGVDMLIFSNNAYPCNAETLANGCIEIPYDGQVAVKAIAHIKHLVESGKLSEARINESYERLKNLKEKL